MAEAVAAFYAVETVAEGAAAGAVAVSGSTVPLHARFQKIKSPSETLALTGSTAAIVKNKLYVIGGERSVDKAKYGESGVNVLSFAADFGSSRIEDNDAIDVDFEFQKPEYAPELRPLEHLTNSLVKQDSRTRDGDGTWQVSWSRTQHSTVAIDDKIYLLGGLNPIDPNSRESNTGSVIGLDTIVAYDTLKSSYTSLQADSSKCTEGIPEDRYAASCTSSPYPPPVSVARGEGPSLDAHGTIFLHGGYDIAGTALHDTWTFDLGTRAWHKFPSIVDTVLQDKSTAGKIAYVEHKLWYMNGSTVMHLDLAEHDPQNNDAMSQDLATLSTGRVGSGQWQVIYPPAEDDPASSIPPQTKDGKTTQTTSSGPHPPTSNVLPITTGAGRNYLVHFSPSNPRDIYLFQIPSAAKTATSIKDTIRDKVYQAIGSLSADWKSGKHEWSKIEVLELNEKNAALPRPDEQLSEFAVANWEDYGNKLALWGGQGPTSGVQNEGWIVDLS